jgi:chaperone modulatory protein CbpM
MAPFHVTAVAILQSQVVEETQVFSLANLCRATGAAPGQVQALVDEGLLEPAGSGPGDWQFSGPSLSRTRTTLRLARELGLSLHGAAIVMLLLTEIDRLKRPC